MLSAALPANGIEYPPPRSFQEMLLRRTDGRVQIRQGLKDGNPGFLTQVVGIHSTLASKVGRHLLNA